MEDPTQEERSQQQNQRDQQDQQESVRRTLSVSSRAAVNTVEQLKTRFAQLQEALRKTIEVVLSQGAKLEVCCTSVGYHTCMHACVRVWVSAWMFLWLGVGLVGAGLSL